MTGSPKRKWLLLTLPAIGFSACTDSGRSSTTSDESRKEPAPIESISSLRTEEESQVRLEWTELSRSQVRRLPFSEIANIGSSTIGVLARPGDCLDDPTQRGEIQIYEWIDGEFRLIETMDIFGSDGSDAFISFIDVTNDEVPELVIEQLCQEFVADIYSVGSQGIFQLGEASYLNDGVLRRYRETCRPDCAAGGVNYYELVWNGTDFDEVLVDKQLPSVSGFDLSGMDMAGWDMAGWDLTDADLNGSFLQGADLSGAVLSNANLSSADLSETNLVGADLRDSDLYGTDFSNANLESADLRGAFMLYTSMGGANLLNANLFGQDFVNVWLDRATMPDGSIYIAGPGDYWND